MNLPQRIFAAVAAALAAPAFAHDFWVQPAAWQVAPEVATPLTLQVGHGTDRQRSAIPKRRIVRFEAIGSDGAVVDLRDGLQRDATQDGVFRLSGAGTRMLVLETDNTAQSRLPANKFNDYLHAEGLTPALSLRERTGRTGAEGSERYSRRAKALVHVGPAAAAAPEAFATPVGLPLEIVLERNPYAVPRAAALPVRVFHRGTPLAGATVKFTDLTRDAEPYETRTTDADGRARFTLPQAGAWLVNVIWTEPQPAGSDVEFETFFSSLSFGFGRDQKN